MLPAIETLPDRVNGDEALVRRGRFLTTTFMLIVGTDEYLVDVDRGRVRSVRRGPLVMPSCTFALQASAEAWSKFWQALPPAGYNEVFAMLKRGELKMIGDLKPFMAHLFYIKFLLASLRPSLNTVGAAA